MAQTRTPKPPWLKVKLVTGENYKSLARLVRENKLHTVCEESLCPNIYECWEQKTATLMILGEFCTRACRFCAVKSGKPQGVDRDEPNRVARAIQAMDLEHVVITSVDRDDLPDGGASIWRETIVEAKKLAPTTTIEVLTPDFQGIETQLQTVLDACPHIFSHNLETVARLTPQIRSKARFDRSLAVLGYAAEKGFLTKTGLMLGLGETESEIKEAMVAAWQNGVSIFSLGQYLQPTLRHHPVIKYYHPDEFALFKTFAEELGFESVEAGPLVRTSYHADAQARKSAQFEKRRAQMH
jgi:lipoic acid synthetase